MTVLSSRFAAPAIALLGLGAVAVWIHALAAPTRDPCANAAAFFAGPGIAGAVRLPWEQLPADEQGVQVRLASGSQPPIFGRVLRTYEPSVFYGSPIRFAFHELLYLEPMPVRSLQAGEDVLPVHWSAKLDGGTAFVEGYFFSQGGTPVRHPLESGLALGPSQLIRGTQPLDVFIVGGRGRPEDLPELEKAAERWLVAAWQEMEAACAPR